MEQAGESHDAMTVVVTGAAGHVGGTLVRALLAQGRSVRALVHRDRRAIEGLDVALAVGDVRDLASLCRAFAGAEGVYHAAGRITLSMRDWRQAEAVNVGGTRNVVDACLSSGVRRLVHFSSIHALEQEPLDVPVDESRLPVDAARCPPYDRSKAAGEEEVRRGIERGLDAVILNPTAIVGPYDFRPSHVGRMLLALTRGTLPALVDGGFDWVDVRDVVAGAIEAETHGRTGARYLLSGHWASLSDLAAYVAEIAGTRPSRLTVPIWLAHLGVPFCAAFAQFAGGEPLYTHVSLRAVRSNRRISHARATRELDYHSRPLRDTVADTLQWFARTGALDLPLALEDS